jgi:hypothetical protein
MGFDFAMSDVAIRNGSMGLDGCLVGRARREATMTAIYIAEVTSSRQS